MQIQMVLFFSNCILFSFNINVCKNMLMQKPHSHTIHFHTLWASSLFNIKRHLCDWNTVELFGDVCHLRDSNSHFSQALGFKILATVSFLKYSYRWYLFLCLKLFFFSFSNYRQNILYICISSFLQEPQELYLTGWWFFFLSWMFI